MKSGCGGKYFSPSKQRIQAEESLLFQGDPGLRRDFQSSQNYIVRPFFKNKQTNNKTNKQKWKCITKLKQCRVSTPEKASLDSEPTFLGHNAILGVQICTGTVCFRILTMFFVENMNIYQTHSTHQYIGIFHSARDQRVPKPNKTEALRFCCSFYLTLEMIIWKGDWNKLTFFTVLCELKNQIFQGHLYYVICNS